MTTRMPIAALYTLCSVFLLTGCLNVPPATQKTVRNKPHEAMVWRTDGREAK